MWRPAPHKPTLHRIDRNATRRSAISPASRKVGHTTPPPQVSLSTRIVPIAPSGGARPTTPICEFNIALLQAPRNEKAIALVTTPALANQHHGVATYTRQGLGCITSQGRQSQNAIGTSICNADIGYLTYWLYPPKRGPTPIADERNNARRAEAASDARIAVRAGLRRPLRYPRCLKAWRRPPSFVGRYSQASAPSP